MDVTKGGSETEKGVRLLLFVYSFHPTQIINAKDYEDGWMFVTVSRLKESA